MPTQICASATLRLSIRGSPHAPLDRPVVGASAGGAVLSASQHSQFHPRRRGCTTAVGPDSMTTQRYKLGLGEAAYGPGDIGLITVVDEGNIAGPKSPGWHAEYMLTRCLTPTSYYGEEVRYLIVSPASSSVTLAN